MSRLRVVAFTLVFALLTFVVLPLDAAADSDFAAGAVSLGGTPPACVSTRGGQSPYQDCALMFDGNDSTFYQTAGGSSNHDDQYCVDIGSAHVITSVRLLRKSDSLPWTQYLIEGSNGITAFGQIQCGHATGTDGWTTVSTVTSGSADITTTFGTAQTYRWWRISASGVTGACGVCAYSFQVFGHAGPSVSDFIKNLVVTHSAPSYAVSWEWIQGHAGIVSGLTCAGCGAGSGIEETGDLVVINPLIGQRSGANFRCGLACSSDALIPPFTLHIVDSSTGEDVTLTFGVGMAVPNVVAPRIAYVQACATGATGCPTGEAAAGHIVFELVAMGSSTAGVSVCQTAPTSDGCLIGGTSYTVGAAAGGTPYDSGVITVNAGSYRMTATNSAGSDTVSFTVTANGESGTAGPTQVTSGCTFGDIGCELRAATDRIVSGISSLLAYLFIPGPGAQQSIDALVTTMQAHEPFATIVATLSTMGAYRDASVSSAAQCPTMTMHMVPGRSSVSQSVPFCLSVITGNSGWSGIRALMGYGVYARLLLWGWSWYRSSIAPEQLKMSWS
jgi:hypothetical protein